jgi:hypothetical protein
MSAIPRYAMKSSHVYKDQIWGRLSVDTSIVCDPEHSQHNANDWALKLRAQLIPSSLMCPMISFTLPAPDSSDKNIVVRSPRYNLNTYMHF